MRANRPVRVPRWQFWMARLFGHRYFAGRGKCKGTPTTKAKIYRWRGKFFVFPSKAEQKR